MHPVTGSGALIEGDGCGAVAMRFCGECAHGFFFGLPIGRQCSEQMQ